MSNSKLDLLYKNDKYIRVGFMDISSGQEKLPVNYKNFNVLIEAFWVNYPFCWVKDNPPSKDPNKCKPSTFSAPCVYPLKDFGTNIQSQEFYNSYGTMCKYSTDCENGICTSINCDTQDKNIYDYNRNNHLCRESEDKCYEPSSIPITPITPTPTEDKCSGTGFKLWRDWAPDGCGVNNSCLNINELNFGNSTPKKINTQFPVLPTNRQRGGSSDKILGYMKSTSSCTLDTEAMRLFTEDLNPDTNVFGGNQFGAYINYFNSMHVANPHNSQKLSQSVRNQNKIILASIGGWGMGGSSNGKPLSGDDVGSIGYYNNWASCLKDIKSFVYTTQQIKNIFNYDGIDIDCETIFAGDMDDFDSSTNCVSGDGGKCYTYVKDTNISIKNTVTKLYDYFSQLYVIKDQIGIISISPRVKDIIESIDDNGNIKLGFMGLIFSNWDKDNILFDLVNIQFYNDELDYCIYYDDDKKQGQIGKNVIPILKYINEKWKGKVFKYLQIGILGKSEGGYCDQIDGGSYCLTSNQLDNLYFNTPLEKLSDGVMLWGINKWGKDSVSVDKGGSFNDTPLSTTWLNEIPKFSCSSNGCVKSPNGTFTSQEECEKNCKWICGSKDNKSCSTTLLSEKPPEVVNVYDSKQDCENDLTNACPIKNIYYKCDPSGGCVVDTSGNSTLTYDECKKNCKWFCNDAKNKKCSASVQIPLNTKSYTNKELCEEKGNCNLTYTCTATTGCTEHTDMSGTLDNCSTCLWYKSNDICIASTTPIGNKKGYLDKKSCEFAEVVTNNTKKKGFNWWILFWILLGLIILGLVLYFIFRKKGGKSKSRSGSNSRVR